MSKEATVPQKAVKSSFGVATWIAKCKQAHTTGKSHWFPAAIDTCRIMIGEHAAMTLQTIPMPNNTIRRPTDALAENVQDQLIEQVKEELIFCIAAWWICRRSQASGSASVLCEDLSKQVQYWRNSLPQRNPNLNNWWRNVQNPQLIHHRWRSQLVCVEGAMHWWGSSHGWKEQWAWSISKECDTSSNLDTLHDSSPNFGSKKLQPEVHEALNV